MIIQSKRVYVASTFMPAQVEVVNGKITNIYPYGTKKVSKDYGDMRVVPGFYDVHTHGYHGYDTSAGGEKGLKKWIKDVKERL